ncbi:MAG: hypothetical protein Q7T89_01415 [Anaerolineales bacterium]|nr:hypothetical protein [Anaerolineales bacterium]
MIERKIIRTEDLTIQDLPSADADWNQITEFALSFDPMLELGEFTLSQDLLLFNNKSCVKELRSYVYFMQRWWNNKTREISKSSLDEIRSAVLLIRSKLLDK